MNPTFDFGDPSIWDDSALVNDWDACLAEYKRYHSIHARGERVEDVLEQHELEQLKKDMGNGQKEHLSSNQQDRSDDNDASKADAASNGNEDDGVAMDMSEGDLEATTLVDRETVGSSHQEITAASAPRDLVPTQDLVVQNQKMMDEKPQYPEALIASVEDEGLKNLMIAWYYSGYYTGLYEGQRKARQGS